MHLHAFIYFVAYKSLNFQQNSKISSEINIAADAVLVCTTDTDEIRLFSISACTLYM